MRFGKYCTAGQDTDDYMAHAHCMMDINIHPQKVILIAFPLQQWLHERASVLFHTHIACLLWLHISVNIFAFQ
jgi:hypothetical protein